MLLAIVTGQRPGDISDMKFSDIWDDMLHIEQEKTGVKLAIPLSVRCQAIGSHYAKLLLSVGIVLSVNTWFIISTPHHRHKKGKK